MPECGMILLRSMRRAGLRSHLCLSLSTYAHRLWALHHSRPPRPIRGSAKENRLHQPLGRAASGPSCDGSKSLNWTDEHSKCVAPLHRCDDLVEVLIVESGCPFVNSLHRGDKRTWVPVQTG